jgi:hypothetical protein
VVTRGIIGVTNKLLNAATKHITERRASVLVFYLITVSSPYRLHSTGPPVFKQFLNSPLHGYGS